MARAGYFLAGLAAGVLLAVAPAAFSMVALTGRSGVGVWLVFFWQQLSHPWRLWLSL